VYSFSEIAHPPHGFEAPYLVALVQLDGGPRVTAQLTDVEPSEVRIGMPVERVVRRLRALGPEGYLVYGYKFRPAEMGTGCFSPDGQPMSLRGEKQPVPISAESK
jgi:uncharacterized OB-fold protein